LEEKSLSHTYISLEFIVRRGKNVESIVPDSHTHSLYLRLRLNKRMKRQPFYHHHVASIYNKKLKSSTWIWEEMKRDFICGTGKQRLLKSV
jgi:hypothetical protein